MTSVVVVGGGITGLVAAREAAPGRRRRSPSSSPDRSAARCEPSAFDGGGARRGGRRLPRPRPRGHRALPRARARGRPRVTVGRGEPRVWSRGELRLLPEGQVLGVPTDLDELAASGSSSPDGLAPRRATTSPPRARPRAATSPSARVIRDRLGDEALERLVDPLVGGINAGDTDQLSLAATVPQLDAAVRSGDAVAHRGLPGPARPGARPRRHPVFFAPRAGMGALVDGPGRRPRGPRRDRRARRRRRAGARRRAAWRVALDRARCRWTADGVVARRAGGSAPPALVRPHAAPGRHAARRDPLRVGGAWSAWPCRATAVDRELDASGFLVPRVEGRTVTACSWTSAKWPHLAGDGTVWLRASVGRDGDDAALVAARRRAGRRRARRPRRHHGAARPADEVRVTRWDARFPQYRPGHLDRVDASTTTWPRSPRAWSSPAPRCAASACPPASARARTPRVVSSPPSMRDHEPVEVAAPRRPRWYLRALLGRLAVTLAVGGGVVAANVQGEDTVRRADGRRRSPLAPDLTPIADGPPRSSDGLVANLRPRALAPRRASPDADVRHGLLEIPSIGLSQPFFEGVTLPRSTTDRATGPARRCPASWGTW